METKQIWKPKKMTKVNPKKVVTEVSGRGVLVGGVEPERVPMMALPPKDWQPWTKGEI